MEKKENVNHQDPVVPFQAILKPEAKEKNQ